MSKSKKRLVPVRRFKEFENADTWEQRKLSDLFIKGGSGGTPKSTNKAFYDGDIPFLGISDITKSNGFINNTEKHISSDGLNSSAAWIVSKGAISLAMYASVGKLAILNIDAATSQAFYNMIFDDYDLRDLVYQRLNKANELSEWNKLISTGTQANLNADKVKNFQMYLPKNHDEIKLISTFFKQIDNTIALHQRKLDKLKRVKSAYLTEMFPAEGEREPKRRFLGFTGAWEERKLGEFTTSFSGGTPSAGNSSYYKGDIPFIRSGEINSDKTELFLTEDGLKNSSAKMVSVGDILYALYGATSGEVGISQINGAINQAILAIKPIDGYSSYFIMQWLKLQKQKIIDKYLQGGQGNLSGSIVKNLILNVPNFEEQQKIGTFFKQLDKTIALHQRKLDKLKKMKAAYINEMFV
ncbi:restriction endonuclease subunit S [Limosilactobacillus fermentum]|uniref:restriction endonuclease subunit S n=1 Tax=Limosilactobacillus fermentum TaxID=1613 RepID=UPI0038913213